MRKTFNWKEEWIDWIHEKSYTITFLPPSWLQMLKINSLFPKKTFKKHRIMVSKWRYKNLKWTLHQAFSQIWETKLQTMFLVLYLAYNDVIVTHLKVERHKLYSLINKNSEILLEKNIDKNCSLIILQLHFLWDLQSIVHYSS